MLHNLIHSGISETLILTAMLMLLVVNELLSGIDIPTLKRIRRFIQIGMIPLGILFIIVAVVRVGHLI